MAQLYIMRLAELIEDRERIYTKKQRLKQLDDIGRDKYQAKTVEYKSTKEKLTSFILGSAPEEAPDLQNLLNQILTRDQDQGRLRPVELVDYIELKPGEPSPSDSNAEEIQTIAFDGGQRRFAAIVRPHSVAHAYVELAELLERLLEQKRHDDRIPSQQLVVVLQALLEAGMDFFSDRVGFRRPGGFSPERVQTVSSQMKRVRDLLVRRFGNPWESKDPRIVSETIELAFRQVAGRVTMRRSHIRRTLERLLNVSDEVLATHQTLIQEYLTSEGYRLSLNRGLSLYDLSFLNYFDGRTPEERELDRRVWDRLNSLRDYRDRRKGNVVPTYEPLSIDKSDLIGAFTAISDMGTETAL